MSSMTKLLIYPGGVFLLVNALVYAWVDRKLAARLQNRLGPRWFQPLADIVKLWFKETLVPRSADARLLAVLPVMALAAVMTAALLVPLGGAAAVSFPGDVLVCVYLLSLLTVCMGLAGASAGSSFSLVGAARLMTQVFAYEVPFLLALLSPAYSAGSWQLAEIIQRGAADVWLAFTQPVGFIVAVISLMGKLELPPFDAPDAETEIVAGALTEYSGRGLALFKLARMVALVVGLALIGSLYLGGFANVLAYLLKTGVLLVTITFLHTLVARLRIDQTVGLWWRWGMLLMLGQWALVLLSRMQPA